MSKAVPKEAKEFIKDFNKSVKTDSLNFIIITLSVHLEELVNFMMEKKFKIKCDEEIDFSLSHKLKVLKGSGEVDERAYLVFDALRRLRNKMVHNSSIKTEIINKILKKYKPDFNKKAPLLSFTYEAAFLICQYICFRDDILVTIQIVKKKYLSIYKIESMGYKLPREIKKKNKDFDRFCRLIEIPSYLVPSQKYQKLFRELMRFKEKTNKRKLKIKAICYSGKKKTFYV